MTSFLEIGDTPISVAIPPPSVFKDTVGFSVGERKAEVIDGVQYNALGLESTEAHKNVSKIWQDKCKKYVDFMNWNTRVSETKQDHNIFRKQMMLNSNGTLKFNDLPLTDYGFESLLRTTDVPSAMCKYLRDNGYDDDLITYVNHDIQKHIELRQEKNINNADKTVFLRTREDKDGNMVNRAILSDRYGIADNTFLLESILDSLPESSHNDLLASHVFSNRDDIYGNVLVPDYAKVKSDSEYGCGIAFKNSEVGKFAFKVSAFLFRAICLNGMIWDRKDSEIVVNKKHLGKIDKDDLRQQVKIAVETGLSEGENILNIFQMTKDIEVKDIPRLIISLSKQANQPQHVSVSWLKQFQVEPDNNVFGVLNGLTRAAQMYTGENRNNMEQLAGRLLTNNLDTNKDYLNNRWSAYIAASKSVEEESVQKILLYN